MSNTLKVALVQEIGDRCAQRTAFGRLNNELRADAPRVARVLGDMFVGRPVETADESVVTAVDTVLAETNNGSQLGFGTEAEARKLGPTLGAGEGAWGEIFADRRHRQARHAYAQRATELRQAEAAVAGSDGDGADRLAADTLAVLGEAAQTAKRQRALAALCVVAELNAVAQLPVASPIEAPLPVEPAPQVEVPRFAVVA